MNTDLRNLQQAQQEKENEKIKLFKPSSIDEIKQLNLKPDDTCEIELVVTCPFTSIQYLDEKIGYVNDIKIQDSEFDFSFCYVNDYGVDQYVSPEYVRIIN